MLPRILLVILALLNEVAYSGCVLSRNKTPFADDEFIDLSFNSKHAKSNSTSHDHINEQTPEQQWSSNHRRFLDRYLKLKRIGKGSYGSVWRALDRDTDEYVAIKLTRFSDAIPSFERESNTLKTLCRNPQRSRRIDYGIVQLKDNYQLSKNEYAIVYELMNGDFYHLFFRKREVLTWEQKRELVVKAFKDLLPAIKQMQRHNMAHADVKLANILYNNGRFKLGDFGQTIQSGLYPGRIFTTYGSISPEILTCGLYSSASDIWALSIELFSFCVGRAVVPVRNERELKGIALHWEQAIGRIPGNIIEGLRKANYTVPLHDETSSSSGGSWSVLDDFFADAELFDFFNKALSFDYKYRLTVDEALEHPFLN